MRAGELAENRAPLRAEGKVTFFNLLIQGNPEGG